MVTERYPHIFTIIGKLLKDLMALLVFGGFYCILYYIFESFVFQTLLSPEVTGGFKLFFLKRLIQTEATIMIL